MIVIKEGTLLQGHGAKKPNFPMACTKCGTFFEIEPKDKKNLHTTMVDAPHHIRIDYIVPCPVCGEKQQIEKDCLR